MGCFVVASAFAACAPRRAARGPAAEGQRVFAEQACNSCHTTDGTPGVGPTLKGLYKKSVTLDNGQTVTADEAYLRESIVDPDAKIVKGYSKGVMKAAVSESLRKDEKKVKALVEYIKTL